jgi:diguanylate cyclase (GGDEF)-like protein
VEFGAVVVRALVIGSLVLGRLVMTARDAVAGLSPRARTALLSAALALIAALISLNSLGGHQAPIASGHTVQFIGLTLTFLLAEQYMVDIEFRRQSHSMTFAGVPLAVGIMLLPAHELVAARVIGSLVAFLSQRIGIEKARYNTCAYAFEAAVSASIVQAVAGSPVELDLAAALYALACIALVDQLMSALVLLVIHWHGGRMHRSEIHQVLGQSAVLSVIATLFAAAVCLLLRQGAVGDVLVVLLLTLAILLYRGYATIRRRHQSLAMVHDFVAESVGADSLEDLARHSLSRIRQLLRCATAELLVVDSESPDESALLKVAATDDEPAVVSHVAAHATDWIRAKALQHGEPTIVARGTKDAAAQKWLVSNEADEALVVPLMMGSRPVGVVTVLDRLGDTVTFAHEDLTLLQTLSSHLSVALRSTRLMVKLSHDATHDSLTALANRAYLSERIAHACGTGRADIAVLLLDLNKFKEVNDVLGHDVGDRLLTVVANRLRHCLPAAATIARLGGDEFAVLLEDLGPEPIETATAHARRAHESLRRPVHFDEAMLAPEASIGVVVGTVARPEDLLRCADTAMYAAKNAGSDVALYRSEMDRGRAERLALVADLRIAVESHPEQFSVFYQPKIDLLTCEVVSAEALLRWNHPTLGIVTPDRFIPLAETSGMIDKLTTQVLAEALATCRSWQDEGFDLRVAVNLSARNFMDATMPDRVADALAHAGVSPDRLILEITEGMVMEDPDRAVPVLRRLSDTGVIISLDDFGTGYSSLSYLQQLPVRELKIDRSFVAGLLGDRRANASALIRTITALGESLDLSVVAEGIESDYQKTALTALGCHVGQGYLISRPLPAKDMREWLTERGRFGRPLRRVVS